MTRTDLAVLLVFLAVFPSCAGPPPAAAGEEPWRPLFDGATLDGWQVTAFGGEGEVTVEEGELLLEQGSPLTGVTWGGEFPTDDYQLQVTARRLAGSDFFCGLTFPVRDDHLTLILGGWGGSLVGLSCLDFQDASENDTTQYHRFETGRPYRVCVTVSGGRVAVTLDGVSILDVDLQDRMLSLRPEVLLCRPLGIASFATRAGLRSLRWRPASSS